MRSVREEKLVAVSSAENNVAYRNKIVLPEKFKSGDEPYMVQLNPGKEKKQTEYSAVYPVVFQGKTTLPEKNMDMGSHLVTFYDYPKFELFPVQIIAAKDLIKGPAMEVNFVIKRCLQPRDNLQIDRDKLREICLKTFKDYPLCSRQSLVVQYEDTTLELVVKSIGSPAKDAHVFDLDDRFTRLNFELDPIVANIQFIEPFLHTSVPKDFNQLGVGGYKEQLERLGVALWPHLNRQWAEKLGIKPEPGILLYGPTGTGKTLVANALKELLNAKSLEEVNVAELSRKYGGNTEAMVEEIFSKGPKDGPVRLIVFDDVDSMVCKASNAANRDTMARVISQLNAKIDKQGRNVLLILTTNNKESLPDTLLRQCRISLHLEFGLPNEAERLEILQIHTQKIKDEHHLADDVDLAELAKKTKDFTGADISSLVSRAKTFSMNKGIEVSANGREWRVRSDRDEQLRAAKVSRAHFERALDEMTRAKDRVMNNASGFAIYNDAIEQMLEDFKKGVQSLKSSTKRKRYNLLISGETGTGKSLLAYKMRELAHTAGITNVRTITANDLAGLLPSEKLEYIGAEYRLAQQSDISMLLLDDADEFLDGDMHARIKHMLSDNNGNANKTIVIATTDNPQKIASGGLMPLFERMLETKNIVTRNAKEAERVLGEICKKLNFRFVPGGFENTTFEMDLPIQSLWHYIDEFCTANEDKLEVKKFQDFLKGKQNLNEVKPSLPAVLGNSGSPLHHGFQRPPSVDKVHYLQPVSKKP